jgi:CheY-like chemotaxis protein
MPTLGIKTILVVEDEPILSEVLEIQMKRLGYRVNPAKNGREALRKAMSALPDLILLDIRLPDLDGFKVATLIRKMRKTRSIPILAVSGLPIEKAECLKSGFNDYLAKPFTNADLVNRVKKLLE